MKSYHKKDSIIQFAANDTTKTCEIKHKSKTLGKILLGFPVPFVSYTTWPENLYFDYLSTPVLKNYMELGYGLNNILFLADIEVFTSFENGRYKSFGAKVGIN